MLGLFAIDFESPLSGTSRYQSMSTSSNPLRKLVSLRAGAVVEAEVEEK